MSQTYDAKAPFLTIQDMLNADIMDACGFRGVDIIDESKGVTSDLAVIAARYWSNTGVWAYIDISVQVSNLGHGSEFCVSDNSQIFTALELELGGPKDSRGRYITNPYKYLTHAYLVEKVTSVPGVFFEGYDISMKFTRPRNNEAGKSQLAASFANFYSALNKTRDIAKALKKSY